MVSAVKSLDNSNLVPKRPKRPNLRILPSRYSQPTFISLACFTLFVTYLYFFWQNISPYYFNRLLTTDDARQQLFPFYKALIPDAFKGDLITSMMEAYLPPVHYWLCYGLTYLTQDPIMAGHWVMFIQLVLSCVFMFLGVQALASTPAAFFAVTWLLHSRHLVQRISGGLPRGWALPLFIAYLCFAMRGQPRIILGLLIVGAITHPPATFVIALGYGLTLLWRFAFRRTRSQARRELIEYTIVAPLVILLAVSVVKMPPAIGKIVNLETAESMPEFHQPNGRFPYLPMPGAWWEIQTYAFHPFVTRFYNPGIFWKQSMPEIVLALTALLALFGLLRKRVVIPDMLWCFAVSGLLTYFLARLFAFRLYVPNRHLQFPGGIFLIMALTIAVWRVFYATKGHYADSSWVRARLSFIGLCLLASLIVFSSGTGLYGVANFNFPIRSAGPVFTWLKNNTTVDALIAGHPTHLDPIQLLSARQAYITTETIHPFYDKYNEEMRRRTDILFRAFYAHDLQELSRLASNEKIDYFVFERAQFRPKELERATYHAPFDKLVETLVQGPARDFAYFQLPENLDPELYPYMVYKDHQAIVIDIKKLALALTSAK